MDQEPINNDNRFLQKLEDLEKKLEGKLDRLITLFENISSKKEKEEETEDHKDVTYILELMEEIEDLDNFDAILELLNQKANSQGYAFKKGVIKKYKDKSPTSKMIVCKYFDRNKCKTSLKSSNPPTDKILIRNIDCQASYRFKINSDKSVFLVKANEQHNHGPYFGQKVELTTPMKVEISRFNKFSRISGVRDHMEATFGMIFDYCAFIMNLEDNSLDLEKKIVPTLLTFWKRMNASIVKNPT